MLHFRTNHAAAKRNSARKDLQCSRKVIRIIRQGFEVSTFKHQTDFIRMWIRAQFFTVGGHCHLLFSNSRRELDLQRGASARPDNHIGLLKRSEPPGGDLHRIPRRRKILE